MTTATCETTESKFDNVLGHDKRSAYRAVLITVTAAELAECGKDFRQTVWCSPSTFAGYASFRKLLVDVHPKYAADRIAKGLVEVHWHDRHGKQWDRYALVDGAHTFLVED